MVIEGFITLILGIFTAILDAIPGEALDLPALTPIIGAAYALDGVLPIHEALDLFLTGVGVLLVVLSFRVLMWVYSVLPFKAT